MSWNDDKEGITGTYFAAINASNIELFKIIGENYNKLERVYPLIEYIIERLNAVTTLLLSDQVWDADIIVRSALETLIKYAFIADAEEADRQGLLNEYWYDLSEIYTIKLSEQAKKNLRHTSDSEIHKLAYSPLVLAFDEEERLRKKWPKTLCSQLEQKWSFTGIVTFLSQKNKGKPLETLEFLTHSYRLSSHIAHGDEIGISIIRERNSRSEYEKNAIYIAHYLRLLSDCFGYCHLTAMYTMLYIKVKHNFFSDLAKSLNELQVLTEQYHKAPFEDKIYDKFR